MIDYFIKQVEIVPLRKASISAVADTFFDNLDSKYGARVK